SLYCASAQPHPNTTASAVRLNNRFIRHPPVNGPCCFCTPAGVLVAKESHAQIVGKFVEIGFELGIGEPVDDAAIFHHVVAIRNRRSEAKILLDQEDGETLLLEHSDGLADLLDDDRGKTLGRLVEEEEASARAQDAADGEHLLLAA